MNNFIIYDRTALKLPQIISFKINNFVLNTVTLTYLFKIINALITLIINLS